jgi:ABC-type nitrate/sulfonate/bicarbonate transport system permease component
MASTGVESAPVSPAAGGLLGLVRSDAAARYTSRVVAIAVWQLAATLFPRIPSPIGTLSFLVDEFREGALVYHLLVSMRRAAIALTAVLVIGILVGFAMGRWWRVRYFFTDLVMVGIALPAFIWALMGVMWWGFSNVAPIVVCIVSATPMLIVNTFEGAQGTPRDLEAMSSAYRVPMRRRFRRLVLPAMMEYIAAGFRVAVLAGWGAVLLVEWFGNDKGAGWRAHYWYDAGSFEGLMGWGLVMMVVIMTIDRAVLERLLRRYRRYRVGRQEWSV